MLAGNQSCDLCVQICRFDKTLTNFDEKCINNDLNMLVSILCNYTHAYRKN